MTLCERKDFAPDADGIVLLSMDFKKCSLFYYHS